MNPRLNSQSDSRQHQKTIWAIAAAVVLLAGLVVWQIVASRNSNTASNTTTPAGTGTSASTTATTQTAYPTISITNFTAIVKNLPDSERQLLEQNLYATVKMNLSGTTTMPTVTDAVIRGGSYRQTYDEPTEVYHTTFLVDIPSLKQTYQVQDDYSSLPPDLSGLYDYTALVLCPSPSDLIYPAFTCQDRLSQESGE